ncbi:2-keto-3-deoxy-galactonokinase [Paracoccus sp. S-4012]|uniref:2-dehydro-3-deoxygalactonokinase n=1 Tax=Paracoccus sp. S-4012 TaxID=2665648 RepID=UPI0012B12101|nr:2-dehydro-3-deoxygalactonokinase [Paracoccus sp. S-4012]MRX50226.1 2-keto-3-deoxy-galactonokinase [Paracoccus sp. S-4012]
MTADWIAIDRTEGRLHAWALGEAGILAETAGRPADAPLNLIAAWLPEGRVTPVIVGGSPEAPLRAVPCPPLGPLVPAPPADPRVEISLVPGLSQRRPSPDLTRSGAIRIAGVLALRPGFDGTICLAGAHSVWAEVSAGEVVSFRGFLTGELDALLATRSTLRDALRSEGFDDAAFDAAVADAIARPEALAARLHGLRAEALLDDLPPDAARARLSGLLIGAELAAARPWWLGREVVILGDEPRTRLYIRALATLGVEPDCLAESDATLAGFIAARALLRGE